METIAEFLYPLVAIISIICYAPQIRKLLFATRRPQNISISSWVIWTISACIALFYGVFSLHDPKFIAVSAINLLLVTFTTGLLLYNRYIRFENKDMSIKSNYERPLFPKAQFVYARKNYRNK